MKWSIMVTWGIFKPHWLTSDFGRHGKLTTIRLWPFLFWRWH